MTRFILMALASLGLQAHAQPPSVEPSTGPLSELSPPSVAPIPQGERLELTLEEALALALRDNRSIRSAYLQRVAERFDLYAAERIFIPQGEVGAEVVRRRSAGGVQGEEASLFAGAQWRAPTGAQLGFTWDRRQPFQAAGRDAQDVVSLNLSQPLLRGAGADVNRAPLRIARLQERINQLRLRAVVSDEITAVILAYRALLEAQERVRLAELSLERARSVLSVNRSMVEAGRMAAADVAQTESAVASQELAVLQAEQDQASAQLSLLRRLAADPETNVVAIDSLDVERTVIDLDEALDHALASRVDVLAQRRSLEQNRQALVIARNDRLWDLSLEGSVSSVSQSDGFLDPVERQTDYAVGIRLGIPLGDVNPRRNEVRAETNAKTAELAYRDLVQGVETQLRDAIQSVEGRWRQLEAARRARDLAQQALQVQEDKLRFGRASNFEVNSLQAELRAADARLLSATIAYLNALTILDQQIGSTLETWGVTLND